MVELRDCLRYVTPLSGSSPRIVYNDGRPLNLRDRRLNRDIRFAHRQGLTHDWVPVRAVIELWGDRAIDFLRADLRAGRLPHALLVHFDFKLIWIKPESEFYIRPEVFERLWIPRADFVGWCTRWGLPIEQAVDFAGKIASVRAPEVLTAPPEPTEPAYVVSVSGGRPSTWSLYETELRSRVAAGECHESVDHWAVALERWFAKAHQNEKPLSPVTLRDQRHIRKTLRDLGLKK
jgi:hypothetical protein